MATACRPVPASNRLYSSLVVPILASVNPGLALGVALRVAHPDGADVYLLDVNSASHGAGDFRPQLDDLRMAYRHGLGARSRVRLHVAPPIHRDSGSGIVAFARSIGADMLVLPKWCADLLQSEQTPAFAACHSLRAARTEADAPAVLPHSSTGHRLNTSNSAERIGGNRIVLVSTGPLGGSS